jgi:hypothetical protein
LTAAAGMPVPDSIGCDGRWRKSQAVVALLAALVANVCPAASDTATISISNDNIGSLRMTLPVKWQGTRGRDELTGASTYLIESKKEKFRLLLEFSYFGQEGRDASDSLDRYIDTSLENYMAYRMPDFTDNSLEGRYTTQAFGPEDHGQYARLTLTDRDSYAYITHGARIVGSSIVLFTLYSSDTDGSILSRAVEVVSSVAPDTEMASSVGSYTCRSEHRVGFSGRNAVWIPDIVDVVDQTFIVRTSSDGDQFADRSTWVFVELGRMRASSWCEETLVEKGLFVCHGASDKEFRMDTGTLRFTYAQLAGYHDVAAGEVLEKDSVTPFMDIGSCDRTER